MTITSAFPTSSKAELMQAAHCLNATITATATAASGSTSFTAVSSLVGVAQGMAITGTGIAGSTYVANITATNAFTSSVATTAAITGGTLTFTGDVFNMALVVASPTAALGAATALYSTLGADEVANGSGYATGGVAMTNVTPLTSGTTGYSTPSNTATWTSATFSTSGCVIYNTNKRLGGVSGRVLGVFSFGGTQSVSSGTFSVVPPTNAAGTALWALT